MKYTNIGSISSGTLRDEDLLEAFADALESEARRQGCLKEHREMLRDARREVLDDVGDLINELSDALNDLSPPYFYFGANEGDGSDFGWWFAGMENYDELAVRDLSEVPTGFTGEVMLVNDHGNATLYRCVRGRLYEQWSIV